MQIKLQQFKVWTTAPDGTPLEGQWGPYVKLSAKFEGYEGWASCIAKPDSPATHWKVNSLVEVESIGQKNGYLVFTLPKKSATPQGQGAGQLWEKLFAKLDRIEKKLDMLTTEPNEDTIAATVPPVDEIDPTDIPF